MPLLAGRRLSRTLWENRSNLDYAWRVLRRGACDACSLGSLGLSDWTLRGLHLCPQRLERLRLNTMPGLDERGLADVSELSELSTRDLQRLGRIPYPLLRRRGEAGFRRIAWEEALELAAERLRASDPDRICLQLDPGGLSNETTYVAQKVTRFLGSPHVGNAAELARAVAPLHDALGVNAATLPCSEWTEAELLVVFGTRQQLVVQQHVALARKRGTRVLALGAEPYTTSPGGELAFLCGVMQTLIEKDGVERDFVEAHTSGFEEFEAAIEALQLDALVSQSGATRSAIFEFAAELCRAKRAVFVWHAGSDAQAYSPDTVRAICSTALLRGFLGQPGSGLAPIPAHAGALASLDMGASPLALPGGPLDSERAARLSELYGFPVPAGPGHTPQRLLSAASEGRIDVLYLVGSDPLGSSPAVTEALPRVPLRVHQGLTLDRAALAEPSDAVLLLPARTRHEQRGGSSVTTSERRVAFSPFVPGRAVAEARSGWEILLAVAQRTHPERAQQISFANPQAIREEIACAIPAYSGLERFTRRGDHFLRGGPRLCEGGECPTPDGRARLIPVQPALRD